ncbi:phosphoribosylglycinamide formyltransferase [Marinospirillum alkaliphilum]|jgi:phosphoribosylglycinamide formyltransferase 1|uniref:Phosphoribosylglycinamide formyltransferase n=1 Tax=Marinospirillum alkaliphilum DSM 21637 TaxID=1122209 RepID=A0A1K1XQ33_9GAMM|nr:phosphoribosylglycinamide formyltransferase [Marinospirillum alkaliphilum]SFX51483.1 formyltetrahydrofolate-dependent phosphoribosylglycinamide formyltransferase [Marinospirillum alkaliphilum DSM 21637]
MMHGGEAPAERRVVVLISGNGSNLQALIDARGTEEGLGGDIVAVISDKADAYGLERARQADIPDRVLSPREFPSREEYDLHLIRLVEEYEPDLIVLAGFMRILSPAFVLRFHGRLINIHPSLLPKYKGLHTHRRALEAGDNEHGLSIHFVTEELDGGPVILQATVPVELDDDESSLARRVQVKEHLLYPIVVRWFLQGRLQLLGNHPVLDGQPLPRQGVLYQETPENQ